MDDLVVRVIPQHAGNLAGLQPFDPPDLVGRVVGQSTGELDAVCIAQRHHVSLIEGANHLEHADRQQASPTALHGPARSLVEYQVTAGLDSEPDPAFARGHRLTLGQDQRAHFLAGDGDCRVLMQNDPVEIRQMVESMVETGKMSGGYMMCIGNHIPYNVPPEAIKLYFDLSAEMGFR